MTDLKVLKLVPKPKSEAKPTDVPPVVEEKKPAPMRSAAAAPKAVPQPAAQPTAQPAVASGSAREKQKRINLSREQMLQFYRTMRSEERRVGKECRYRRS